jgi:2-alkyl-3-oxoalkanoate reductase
MSASGKQFRVGLVGTGNIAHVHAQAVKAAGQTLTAVFDTNAAMAASFAKQYGVAAPSASMQDLFNAVDVVHVLTPPGSHGSLVQQALAAGKHVLVEKPVVALPSEIEAVRAAAQASQQVAAVNQNFVFMPAFAQLKELVDQGAYGKLKFVDIVFHPPLRQLAARQFTHWMFASRLNLLLEQAVHPLSQLQALIGPITQTDTRLMRDVHPTASSVFSPELSASMRSEMCAAQFHFMVGADFPVWQLRAFCTDGTLTADMLSNTLQVHGRTAFLDPLDHAVSLSRSGISLAKGAVGNLATYGASQLGLVGRSDAFFQSIKGSVAHYYDALAGKTKLITSAEFGLQLVELCDRMASAAQPAPAVAPVADAALMVPATKKGRVLVTGGTGFIGKPTVKALLEDGFTVRVMARNVGNLDAMFAGPGVEVVRGDVKREADLEAALQGCDYVLNLAHGGGGNNFDEIYRAMIDSALALVRLSAKAGVKRFVHTGSIAGLYLGDSSSVIRGATPPDPQPELRADYARAKALGDAVIAKACANLNLECVVLRPGLVVGQGTGALHSGLGFFNNDQHVVGWGDGTNPLPFVLVEDCASANVAALTAPNAAGKAYNLVGDVCLNARDYLEQLRKATGRAYEFHSRSPRRLWLEEMMKWSIKRVGGRKPPMPAIRDFRSRALYASFDCSDAKSDLGWKPVDKREAFIAKAIEIHA